MSASNEGHGHVTPRADGTKARCGGPAICSVCRAEREAVNAALAAGPQGPTTSLHTGFPKLSFDVPPATRADEYDEVWLCRDGRRLRVCDMSEEHVRATLNMLLRNRRRRNELKRELKAVERWTNEHIEDDAKWGRS